MIFERFLSFHQTIRNLVSTNNTSLMGRTFLLEFSCYNCIQNRQKRDAHSSSTVSKPKRKAINPRNKEDEQEHKTVEQLVQYLKGNKQTAKKSSYVFDKNVAKKLVGSVMSHRVNPQAPVLEIEPGMGLISQEFLKQGVERVVGLETESHFHSHLQLVQEEYGEERFSYHNWNMLNTHEKFNDSRDVGRDGQLSYGESEEAVVTQLSKSVYSRTETPYSMFVLGGSQSNHNLMFYILRHLPTEDPILSKQRVEFFLLVHPKFKLSIEAVAAIDEPSTYTRYYSYRHTCICLLYDVSFLDEFDVTDFVPTLSKQGPSKKLNVQRRHLCRLQLKTDIADLLPFEQHHAFTIFLRHVFRKRKIRIIPVMEMLVSGCGLRMLAMGFSMMETVADVSPRRLLALYKSMLGWPEYSVSHLKNHILMKTQGGPMEEDEG